MEGRRQKVREGKWNGGLVPYGYKLENGELLIAGDEAEVIRIIYDKYVNTTMGATAVATYLNEHGYVKEKRVHEAIIFEEISGDNIYEFLLYFDKLYDRLSDAKKKEFLNSFIERVDIYVQEQPDDRLLKHIKFRCPVYLNGKETEEMSWDNETIVETVYLSSKLMRSSIWKKKEKLSSTRGIIG